MAKCKNCVFDTEYNCKREVKTNEFTGITDGYRNKNIKIDGKCKTFKPKPKRTLADRLLRRNF